MGISFFFNDAQCSVVGLALVAVYKRSRDDLPYIQRLGGFVRKQFLVNPFFLLNHKGVVKQRVDYTIYPSFNFPVQLPVAPLEIATPGDKGGTAAGDSAASRNAGALGHNAYGRCDCTAPTLQKKSPDRFYRGRRCLHCVLLMVLWGN